MALFDFRDTADALADLLDREREAILKGRFDLLERLIPEKERLTARLTPDAVGDKAVRGLKQKADHNARLLDAMRVGLRDAGARIAAIRKAPEDLHTYDATGRRTILGQKSAPRQLR